MAVKIFLARLDSCAARIAQDAYRRDAMGAVAVEFFTHRISITHKTLFSVLQVNQFRLAGQHKSRFRQAGVRTCCCRIDAQAFGSISKRPKVGIGVGKRKNVRVWIEPLKFRFQFPGHTEVGAVGRDNGDVAEPMPGETVDVFVDQGFEYPGAHGDRPGEVHVMRSNADPDVGRYKGLPCPFRNLARQAVACGRVSCQGQLRSVLFGRPDCNDGGINSLFEGCFDFPPRLFSNSCWAGAIGANRNMKTTVTVILWIIATSRQ